MNAERFGPDFRPVRRRFRELAAPARRSADPDPADRTGDPAARTEPGGEVVTRRPERPETAECDRNHRARSARLRVLRRRPEAAATAPTPTPGGAR